MTSMKMVKCKTCGKPMLALAGRLNKLSHKECLNCRDERRAERERAGMGANGWHVSPSDDYDQPHVLDWSGNVIAVLPEDSAHGPMIAAATEMLEALRWVRANYAAGSTTEINARIDAAISKAEGR